MNKAFLRKILPPPVQNIISSLKHGTFKQVFFEELEHKALRKKIGIKIEQKKKINILFYPLLPDPGFEIYRICRINGYGIVANPNSRFDFVFNWQGNVFVSKDELLDELAKKYMVINYGCKDTNKENVDKIFTEIFGYSTMVDPMRYNGKCVVKSNLNAKHDGKVIDCPIKTKEDGVVYQKLIDNQYDNEYVYDIRVTVFKNKIPMITLKLRATSDRFAHVKKRFIKPVDQIFSDEEIKKILLFAEKIGMEYGHLDVLRDNHDKRIYIIDANPCPWSNTSKLSKEEITEVYRKLTICFNDVYVGDFNNRRVS